jgi:hypothetical protein
MRTGMPMWREVISTEISVNDKYFIACSGRECRWAWYSSAYLAQNT